MIPASPVTRFALLSVGAAVATFVLKLVAWHLTGSVTLLSDALESVANLAAALVAVASVTVSARPADEEHPYGHTKVEYFAGGVEGALILVAAGGGGGGVFLGGGGGDWVECGGAVFPSGGPDGIYGGAVGFGGGLGD